MKQTVVIIRRMLMGKSRNLEDLGSRILEYIAKVLDFYDKESRDRKGSTPSLGVELAHSV